MALTGCVGLSGTFPELEIDLTGRIAASPAFSQFDHVGPSPAKAPIGIFCSTHLLMEAVD
jgi:hypothetical protein